MSEIRDIIEPGIPGITPSISVGEVYTVDSWDEARVTLRGTVIDPILDFYLPEGLPGPGAVANDVASEALILTAGTKTSDALNSKFAKKPTTSHDIRDWPSLTIKNDGTGDNYAAFNTILGDLRRWHDESAFGVIHELKLTGGDFAFSKRLTPPAGSDGNPMRGYFAIRGEGRKATRFLTSPSNSWIGIDQFQVGDADWAAEHMYFSDFTVVGSRQATVQSGGYTAGLKGFILHNIRQSVFERVGVYDTHATGFGIDYSEAWLIDCWAEYCGRGRAYYEPDVTKRVGSGSGAGIGYGQKPDEMVTFVNFTARYNAAAGIFGEHLGQPEALYMATGMKVNGALLEYNAIGINDTGTRGSQFNAIHANYNSYCAARIGTSNASEQGGKDGRIDGLSAHGNQFGLVFEGLANSRFEAVGLDIWGCTQDAIVFRDASTAWPGRNIRLQGSIHDNGGHGVAAYTIQPIVGLTADLDIWGNSGAGYYLASPLARPNLRGRVFGNGSFAVDLPGSAALTSPRFDLDVYGSANGVLRNQHTTDDASRISMYGNPTTVTNQVTKATPDSGTPATTDWLGQASTLTYAASFVGEDGRDIGPHIVGTATGNSPRVISTPVNVAPGAIFTHGMDVIGPKGKSFQPSVRVGSGGTAFWIVGGIVRCTGSVQRVYICTTNTTGATIAMRGGVIGASSAVTASQWNVGDVIRATRSCLTLGDAMWPHIEGNLPNCAYTGASGASTSVLTIPTVPGGFVDTFDRADGPVGTASDGKAWTVASNVSSHIPLVVSGNRGTYGSGGTAARSVYLLEGGSVNGTLEAKIGTVGIRELSLIVHGIDASNFVRVMLRRNSSSTQYAIAQRVANSETELAVGSASVTSNDADLVQITVVDGAVQLVKVNGSAIFGGTPIPFDASLAASTKHGLMLVSTSTTRLESLEYIKWTPAA